VKGRKNGVSRGWFFNASTGTFLSDRTGETYTPTALRALAAPGSEQTYTLVVKGTGRRIGIDRDLDGLLDGDLTMNSFVMTTNGPRLSWNSLLGATYQLQFKNNLSDTTWNNVPGATITGTGNLISLTDTFSASTSARFYRVITTE